MLTCTKIWNNLIFTHRQFNHNSKCSRIHGHNWKLELTFACDKTDSFGFVVDYSALEYINDWIKKNLDYTTIFSENDPAVSILNKLSIPNKLDLALFQIVTVKNASTEGIAEFIYNSLNSLVLTQTTNRAWISEVRLWESSTASVTYEKPLNSSR